MGRNRPHASTRALSTHMRRSIDPPPHIPSFSVPSPVLFICFVLVAVLVFLFVVVVSLLFALLVVGLFRRLWVVAACAGNFSSVQKY